MASTSGGETDLGPLSRDAFLGGRLTLAQPVRGYRSGADAVFLAAAVPGQASECLLELGCGAGVAMLCAAVRVPGLQVTGVEVQAGYAALARQNATDNGITAEVHTADIAALPRALLDRRFDHVIANPPYHPPGSGKPASDGGRHLARAGEADMALWLDTASRRLAPRGRLTLIQQIGRLREVLAGLPPSLGSVVVLPLAGRAGRAPERFILRATKGGRGVFRLLAPFVLHRDAAHLSDAADYRSEVEDILRNGAKLSVGD